MEVSDLLGLDEMNQRSVALDERRAPRASVIDVRFGDTAARGRQGGVRRKTDALPHGQDLTRVDARLHPAARPLPLERSVACGAVAMPDDAALIAFADLPGTRGRSVAERATEVCGPGRAALGDRI